MKPILVSGLINIETTVAVASFPIAYEPVRYPFFGLHSSVAGVGYNISRALLTLGAEPRFLSLIGSDLWGDFVLRALEIDSIPGGGVIQQGVHTAQSAILYEPSGRRMIHVDLKDIQEQLYPPERVEAALAGCELAALCNINFSRPMLAQARRMGIPIATDVHTLHSIDDDYNRDFMAAAQILFLSDERLPDGPEAMARALLNRYGAEIIVIGMGARGCLLCIRADRFMERIPTRTLRPVVNSIGAGDALFSAFLHFYARSRDPYGAIRQAVKFASWKVGVSGAAEGFLSEAELLALG